MSLSSKQLIQEALQLSSNERANIAEELIASLDTVTDMGVEQAWQKEVEKRIREIDQNKVKMISWEEVQKQLKE